MEHPIQIQTTNNYDMFSLINGNRNISQKKVQRIIDDVKSGLNLFPYCPIIVNEAKNDLQIIDGQHRFEASKTLDGPIYYVVAKDISIRDIARMNSNTDKWKYRDFLECYIKLGMKDYQILKDFIKKHNLQFRTAISLLMNGVPESSGRHAESFMDGKFKVGYLEEATEFMGLVDRLVGDYVFSRDLNLMKAIHKLEQIGKWDKDVMESKIHSHSRMMDKQTTPKTYMYLLQQIYNVGNHNHRNIL